MTKFYISVYFIITMFLNDAIRFCSKMPLSGHSCCTEICRARRSTGVCAMEVFTAWHYLTGKRYKTLLLFNSHLVLRRRGDVAATSLFTSQWRHRYVSNETLHDVSMERRQHVSVVRLYDVLLERYNDVSIGRNNDAPSLRLQDVSNKS